MPSGNLRQLPPLDSGHKGFSMVPEACCLDMQLALQTTRIALKKEQQNGHHDILRSLPTTKARLQALYPQQAKETMATKRH